MPVVVVVTPVVCPIRTVPIGVMIPRIAPIGIRIPGIAPIRVPTPIGSPIRTIAPSHVDGWVIVPIEGVVAIYVDIGVATVKATGVIVVIIV